MADGFNLDEGVRALSGTPAVLRALLAHLPEDWVHCDEGPGTWSPFEVVGHLIHGEKTDWIPRARQILEGPAGVPFQPFDRFAQVRESRGKSLGLLLDEFEDLRVRNLEALESFGLGEADLDREGIHPEFGTVTLRQLLATWVTHDYSHVGQIARVLAKRHKEDVGPWARYLSILHR